MMNQASGGLGRIPMKLDSRCQAWINPVQTAGELGGIIKIRIG